MKPKDFLKQLDEARLVAAIAEAEGKSSGEIRVYISHLKNSGVMADAQSRFVKFGMTKTRERNGVLICFAPFSQEFAIIGDTGINEKCDEAFWQDIVSKMVPNLKAGQYTNAIVEAIQEVGAVLARHFPRQAEDKNELPNQILRDERPDGGSN